MNKRAETIRDRRISRDEAKRLLDTALLKINDGVHRAIVARPPGRCSLAFTVFRHERLGP